MHGGFIKSGTSILFLIVLKILRTTADGNLTVEKNLRTGKTAKLNLTYSSIDVCWNKQDCKI